MNNLHLTCLAKVIRLRKPKFLHGAPDCACWSKATDFPANNRYAMKNILQKRKNQENILARFGFICKTAINNGAHIMIENPSFSKIWKQPIMLKILSIGTNPKSKIKRTWRFFDLNMCQTSGDYFKSKQFFTTAPVSWTEHMELKCNHSFKYPPCIGRDENNRNRTKGTSAYTKDLIYMILCVVAHCISSPGLVKKLQTTCKLLMNKS